MKIHAPILGTSIDFPLSLFDDDAVSDEAITKPTIEPLLERINFAIEENRAFREQMTKEFADFREAIDVRLDRIESEVKLTHSELYGLCADFKELRSEFNEFRSQFKQPA